LDVGFPQFSHLKHPKLVMVGMSLDQSYLQHTAAVRAMRVTLRCMISPRRKGAALNRVPKVPNSLATLRLHYDVMLEQGGAAPLLPEQLQFEEKQSHPASVPAGTVDTGGDKI
jgi:hypothetical protein